MLVTAKVTVQFPLFGIVMPLKLKAVAPADRVFGDVPTQVPPTAPPTALIFDKVSVNAAPVNAPVGLLLVKVSVTVDIPPEAIEVGAKALAIVGGAMTVMPALAVAPAPSSVVESGTELFFTPAVVPVTLTLNAQFEFAAKVAPERAIEPAPAFAVIVPPPHVPVRFGGVATTKPAGRVSVKLTLLSENAALLLVMVKLKEVVPFN